MMKIYKIYSYFLKLLNKFIVNKVLANVYSFYFQKIDDKFNLNIFNKIGLSNYILQFHQNKKKINNPNLSFHYDILFALGQKFKNKKINILEIGTYEGEFANFFSFALE